MLGRLNSARQRRTLPAASSSISSTVASPNRGAYCISKAGLSMATQLWAVRLAEFGIPVYEVRPGVTRSDMTRAVEARYDRLIEEGLLLQPRWGVPEDIGKAVVARGDLCYSTGQVIMVDGGRPVARLGASKVVRRWSDTSRRRRTPVPRARLPAYLPKSLSGPILIHPQFELNQASIHPTRCHS